MLRNRNLDRRKFLFGAGSAGLLASTGGGGASASGDAGDDLACGGEVALTDKEKVARIASNSYPIRWIFKNRGNVRDKATVASMQAKYGTITMLAFPEFTKKTFAGVTKMDL